MQPTHHPPPASRATARGVEIGGHHCHEPLLVGGKGCYARGGAWQGVFSTGIQWNSWIPGSPIGIGGGV
jgi:hypothetical protein